MTSGGACFFSFAIGRTPKGGPSPKIVGPEGILATIRGSQKLIPYTILEPYPFYIRVKYDFSGPSYRGSHSPPKADFSKPDNHRPQPGCIALQRKMLFFSVQQP